MLRFLVALSVFTVCTSATAQPRFVAPPPAKAHSGAGSEFFVESATPSGQFFLPTGVAFGADGTAVVIEKIGGIFIVQPDGSAPDSPTLSLFGEVYADGDRGLIGATLHPDFPTTRYLYLLYTVDDSAAPRPSSNFRGYTRLTRFTISDDNLSILPESRRVLLGETAADGIPACYNSHAAGALRFGHDGMLYVGHGDGASWTEPDGGGLYPECFDDGGIPLDQDLGAFRSQSINSLSGKILRLDPETGLGVSDNPFWTGDGTDAASRVWALGLRNPFRFALAPQDPDNPDRVELVVGDVGDGAYEELNRVTGGENLGWPCVEGPSPHPSYPSLSPPSGMDCSGGVEGTLTAPWAYFHHFTPSLSAPSGLTAASITGGGFYLGESYPERFHDALFFADYSEGWVYAGRLGDTGLEAPERVIDTPTIVDLAYDPTRDVMVGVDIWNGRLVRFRHTGGGNAPPIAQATSTARVGEVGLEVTFRDAGSVDPAGGALAYAWTFGTGDTAVGPEVTYTYATTGTFLTTLTVTNPEGVSAQTVLPVSVGLSLPTLSIQSPTGYVVGPSGVLELELAASDARGETLDTFWEIDLVHNEHTHPSFSTLDAASGTVSLVPHAGPGEVAYYRARAVVVDEEGLRVSEARTLRGFDADEIEIGAAPQTQDAATVLFPRPLSIGGLTVPVDVWRDGATVEVLRGDAWSEARYLHALPEGDVTRVLIAGEPVDGVRFVGLGPTATPLSLIARVEAEADLDGWDPSDAGDVAPGRTVPTDSGLMLVGAGAFGDGSFHTARRVLGTTGSVVARMDAISGARGAMAGVSVQTGLGADARRLTVAVGNDGVVRTWSSPGAPLEGDALTTVAGPAWLRIRASGASLVAEASEDGDTWVSGETVLVDGREPLTGGPAVAGGELPGVAWFDNLSVSSDPGAPPPAQAIRVRDVYPNPGSGIATTVVEAWEPGTYSVSVIDALGRVVTDLPTETITQPRVLEYRIARRGLAAGVYAVQVRHDESGYVGRVSFVVAR